MPQASNAMIVKCEYQGLMVMKYKEYENLAHITMYIICNKDKGWGDAAKYSVSKEICPHITYVHLICVWLYVWLPYEPMNDEIAM